MAAFAGPILCSLLPVGVSAPVPVRSPRPEYVAALQAAPEFAWALEQLTELVLDTEWDPRPAAKSPRLNPDGSYFNRWTQDTLVDVGLSMAGAVAASQDPPNPFASYQAVAPSVHRIISRVAELGDGILDARSGIVARMLDIGQVFAPSSSRLVDEFMPRVRFTRTASSGRSPRSHLHPLNARMLSTCATCAAFWRAIQVTQRSGTKFNSFGILRLPRNIVGFCEVIFRRGSCLRDMVSANGGARFALRFGKMS